MRANERADEGMAHHFTRRFHSHCTHSALSVNKSTVFHSTHYGLFLITEVHQYSCINLRTPVNVYHAPYINLRASSHLHQSPCIINRISIFVQTCINPLTPVTLHQCTIHQSSCTIPYHPSNILHPALSHTPKPPMPCTIPHAPSRLEYERE